MTIAYIAAAVIGLLGIMYASGAMLGLNQTLTKWRDIAGNTFAAVFGGGLILLALHVAGLL